MWENNFFFCCFCWFSFLVCTRHTVNDLVFFFGSFPPSKAVNTRPSLYIQGDKLTHTPNQIQFIVPWICYGRIELKRHSNWFVRQKWNLGIPADHYDEMHGEEATGGGQHTQSHSSTHAVNRSSIAGELIKASGWMGRLDALEWSIMRHARGDVGCHCACVCESVVHTQAICSESDVFRANVPKFLLLHSAVRVCICSMSHFFFLFCFASGCGPFWLCLFCPTLALHMTNWFFPPLNIDRLKIISYLSYSIVCINPHPFAYVGPISFKFVVVASNVFSFVPVYFHFWIL